MATSLWSILTVLLLGIAAASKLFMLGGAYAPPFDMQVDLVTGLSRRTLLWSGLLLDVAGVVGVLMPKRGCLRGLLLFWVGSLFLLYHGTSLLLHSEVACPCLGSLTLLGGGSELASSVLSVLASVFLFLFGSYTLGLSIPQRVSVGLDSVGKVIERWVAEHGTWKEILVPVLCLTIAASIGLIAPMASGLQFGDDEAFELQKALSVADGYRLYLAVWSDQPPLLTFAYAFFFQAGGVSPLLPRLFSLGCFLMVLMALGIDLWRRAGLAPAVLFIGLLPTCASVLKLSVSAMQEMPSVAFAVLAITLARRGLENGTWILLGMACVSSAIAILIKFTALLFLAAYIVSALITAARAGDNVTMRRLAIACAAVVGICAAVLTLPMSWHTSQLLGTHFNCTAVAGLAERDAYRFALSDFNSHPTLFIVSLLSVAWILSRRVAHLWLFECSLFGLMAMVAVLHRPWWSYYHLDLGVAVSLVSAIGIWDCCSTISRWMRNPLAVTRMGGLVVLWCLMTFMVMVASAARWWSGVTQLYRTPRALENGVVSLLEGYRHRVRWAVSDRGIYLFHAGLRTPPEFAVLSMKRFWSGQISKAEIYELLDRYAPEIIFLSRENLAGFFADFESKASQYKVASAGAEHVLYERSGPKRRSFSETSSRTEGGTR